MYTGKGQTIYRWLTLLLGILGAVFGLALKNSSQAPLGLVPAGHPLGTAMVVTAGAAVALALCGARLLGRMEGYEGNFPGSLGGFLGHMAAALGILMTVLSGRSGMQGGLHLVWQVLGFASVPCLGAAACFRFLGKKPFFGLHLCPGLFLVFHTINQYQRWSSDPQLLNYSFCLLAVLSMVFYAFYHSAFDAGFFWRRRLGFFSMASAALGCMALPTCRYPWLYLGMILWALLDHPAPLAHKEGKEA